MGKSSLFSRKLSPLQVPRCDLDGGPRGKRSVLCIRKTWHHQLSSSTHSRTNQRCATQEAPWQKSTGKWNDCYLLATVLSLDSLFWLIFQSQFGLLPLVDSFIWYCNISVHDHRDLCKSPWYSTRGLRSQHSGCGFSGADDRIDLTSSSDLKEIGIEIYKCMEKFIIGSSPPSIEVLQYVCNTSHPGTPSLRSFCITKVDCILKLETSWDINQ